jgi:DeoR/GlpR family transcriptional regulator of sugar metabolism
MKNRQNKILELLTKQQKIEVSTLSKILEVSQVTIRKDLDALEEKGIIKREHGFALLCSKDDINGRIAYHYETKRKIAMRATDLINDGDTIMVESGSCCTLFTEVLTECKKDLTIITNSAYIANYIRGKSNFQIILLGGIYQQEAQVNVGPMIQQGAENFFVDLYFIGTDGYFSSIGFTNRDQMRAQAVRDMAKQASKVVVLTESEKFSEHGIVPLNLKEKVGIVITDDGIEDIRVSELKEQKIEVITVEV